MAIIGFGGKQYNQYVYKGQSKELEDLFKRCGIKKDSRLNDKLEETDLTPRRLIRIFRYEIRKYLKSQKEITSYLWNKYSDHAVQYREICFPGAEHLVDKDDQAKYLYKCYQKLDESLDRNNKESGLSKRAERVFLSRGFKYLD